MALDINQQLVKCFKIPGKQRFICPVAQFPRFGVKLCGNFQPLQQQAQHLIGGRRLPLFNFRKIRNRANSLAQSLLTPIAEQSLPVNQYAVVIHSITLFVFLSPLFQDNRGNHACNGNDRANDDRDR